MVQVADASVVVRGDLSKFGGDLKGAGGQVDKLGAKFKSALTPGNLLAAGGVAFGAAQVVSFFGDAVQAAGEFEDSVAATGVIFSEEAIPALEEWADGAAQAFGASKQQALEAANGIAVFGKAAGLAGTDLIDFSTDLTELAGDLASMFGGSTEDAITAVGAALRGESEPIRRYGVLLDDATLRQRAFEMGITDTIKNALTPQQRTLAAQAEIMAQTTDAQGDFARTSDGLMNSQRILAAELENVSIEIGEKMLPIMVELVHFVSDVGIPAIEGLTDALSNLGSDDTTDIPILGEIETALNLTQDASHHFGSMIRGEYDRVVQASRDMGVDFNTAHSRISQVMRETGVDFQTALDGLVNKSEAVGDGLMTILPQSIKEATSSVGEAADAVGAEIPEGIEEGVEEAVEIAKRLPGDLAAVLEPNIDDYQTALDELSDVAVNSVSDMTERQVIEGVLGSKQLTDALNSDSTRTQLLAQQFVADRIEEYNLLAPGALAAGTLVNPQLLAGVQSNINLATDAGDAVVDAAGAPLVDTQWAQDAGYNVSARFALGMELGAWLVYEQAILTASKARGVMPSSEPKDPHSPFRGLIDSGMAVGERFAMGMRKSIPIVHGASLAMAGAAVGLRHGGLTPLGGTYGTPGIPRRGVGGDTFNVTIPVQGLVYGRSAKEIGSAVKRYAESGKLERSKVLINR